MFNSNIVLNEDQGLVVQIIVSLTMSLRCKLVKYMPTTLSHAVIFC